MNLFVKPDEQSQTCLDFAMARKGLLKNEEFFLPNKLLLEASVAVHHYVHAISRSVKFSAVYVVARGLHDAFLGFWHCCGYAGGSELAGVLVDGRSSVLSLQVVCVVSSAVQSCHGEPVAFRARSEVREVQVYQSALSVECERAEHFVVSRYCQSVGVCARVFRPCEQCRIVGNCDAYIAFVLYRGLFRLGRCLYVVGCVFCVLACSRYGWTPTVECECVSRFVRSCRLLAVEHRHFAVRDFACLYHSAVPVLPCYHVLSSGRNSLYVFESLPFVCCFVCVNASCWHIQRNVVIWHIQIVA